MEYSMCSDKGTITTSSLSSSSSRSASPSSSSLASTNYPPLLPPAAVTSPPESSSSSSSPNSPPSNLPPVAITSLPSPQAATPVAEVSVISSCSACKYLGWSCEQNCMLATCFPPNDLVQFIAVHRVFGATNIIKLLQELPECQRADAVSSMAYEANARLRDPVYGCVGAICHLQGQVQDLQAQLAKAQAELVNMQCQQANLIQLLCMEMDQSPQASPQQSYNFTNTPMSFLDENNNLSSVWEALWT